MICIIPDVHEKINKLQRIIAKYDESVSHFIFLGDFLDSWDGLTWNTHETCRWLKENVANPKYTFLYGNHDIHYAYPLEGLICSGYTRQKQMLVGGQLRLDEHWSHFRLIAWADEWLCTHAGIHPHLLHPVYGADEAILRDMEKRALDRLQSGEVDPLVAPGRGRGGRAPVGGLTWLDWETEFTPSQGLNQIVGHTAGHDVRSSITDTSSNYCLDTDLNHVALIENNSVEIQDVKGV
jgi:hypothetical protein